MYGYDETVKGGRTMGKSSSGFGIGTIIFAVVVYNLLFSDDDENEIEIVDKVKSNKTVQQILIKAKETIIEVKDSEAVQEIIENAKEQLQLDQEPKQDEPPLEDVAELPQEKIKEEKPEESSPTELLVPAKEEQPKTEEFEKL